MFQPGKKAPLTGLELVPEVLLSCDAAGIQQSRRKSGLDLAAALLGGELEWVNTEEGPAVLNRDTGELVEDRSAAFAALLAFAADESNHVSGLLDDGHGGTFHAGAALWKSSLRLDPNWMETMRRRSRSLARLAMHRMGCRLTRDEILARRLGWHQRLGYKLVTLTMPHLSGRTTLEETRRINAAFTLLKKREYWRDLVAGGVKGVEDALDFAGPHVHLHLFLMAKRMDRPQLVAEWWTCVNNATRKLYGHGLAEDSPIVVDVRQVRNNPKKALKADELDLEDALNEVTKYITKPADFLKRDELGRQVPRQVLLDICEVRRWPRMFEILGRCREKAARPVCRANAATAALVFIHRAYSTGTPFQVPPGVGWELVAGWDIEADGPDELRKSIVHALKEREKEGPTRIRPPSWRDLMDTTGLPEWLRIMAERFRRGKQFRMDQLLAANPSAWLVTFDGQAFGTEPTSA
jgi:hypothetical protein